MTYRTGNHWGVTIVRENDLGPAATSAELVAVVVNGDQALAARIAALLTTDERCWHGEHCPGSGPDCERDAPLKGGHRDCADAWHAEHGCCTEPYDGDAPSGRAISPQSASGPSGVVGPGLDVPKPAEIASGRFEVYGDMNADGSWLELSCTRCPWHAEIEDPTDLAELNRRAGEHTEVCR